MLTEERDPRTRTESHRNRIGVLSHEIGSGERDAMASWTFSLRGSVFVAASHIQ